MDLLGFSTGCFYKLFEDTLSNDVFNVYKTYKINNLEILVRKFSELDRLLQLDPEQLQPFKYLSLHAPGKDRYTNNLETIDALKKIAIAVKKYNIQTVVLHPEVIDDWSIFAGFPQIPFAIENMDDKKPFGQIPQDLKRFFDKYKNFGFVLDMQHIYVNDKTMELANAFIEEYADKLVEIHLSAFDETLIHSTLFQKSQDIILHKLNDIIRKKRVPIIIESTFNSIDEAAKELSYIKQLALQVPKT